MVRVWYETHTAILQLFPSQCYFLFFSDSTFVDDVNLELSTVCWQLFISGSKTAYIMGYSRVQTLLIPIIAYTQLNFPFSFLMFSLVVFCFSTMKLKPPILGKYLWQFRTTYHGHTKDCPWKWPTEPQKKRPLAIYCI